MAERILPIHAHHPPAIIIPSYLPTYLPIYLQLLKDLQADDNGTAAPVGILLHHHHHKEPVPSRMMFISLLVGILLMGLLLYSAAVLREVILEKWKVGR